LWFHRTSPDNGLSLGLCGSPNIWPEVQTGSSCDDVIELLIAEGQSQRQ
jgi:hypothetical protein